MKLFYRFGLSASVSRFALSFALGAAMVGSVGLSGAVAANITYTGDGSSLQQDPTGNQGVTPTYNSLYEPNVYTGNTITVDGGT